MGRHEQIQQALDACYDAIVDPSCWADALHGLARSLGAVSCMLYPEHPDATLVSMPASHDFKDFLAEFLRDGWWQRDHRALRGWPLVRAGRQVLLEHDVASDEERRTLPVYHDLYRRYGVPWWAAVGFAVSGRHWCLPLLRSESAGPFTLAEAAELKRLVPHLRRMVSISEQLVSERVASALDVLDCCRTAALVLDWRGNVLRLNRKAEALMGNGLGLVARRLHATDRNSDARLQPLIAAAVSPEAAGRASAVPAAAAEPVPIRREGLRPLVAEAMQAAGLFSDVLHQARALLFVTDLEESASVDPAAIASVLSLTSAEAHLVSRLVAGDDLARAASALGISTNTVRTQIKAVFAKTETHRQSDLVLLASRLRTPG